MKKKFVFDCDGVLRDFGTIFHNRFKVPYTNDWHFTYQGKNVYDWTKEDYSILYKAEPTQYLDIIKQFTNGSKIEIWTHQPDDWIKYTKKWLRKYLGNKFIVKYFTPEDKYRKLKENPNLFLVDDYPFFPENKQIILIDYPYNQEVKPFVRIKNKEDLKKLLESYK